MQLVSDKNIAERVLTGRRYPEEVVIDGAADDAAAGTNTPSGEPDDDFFSSWDKPTIKRPSNPPSRTGTPANATSRTASPFLNVANGNGTAARPKSPLAASSDSANTATAAAIKSNPSAAAIRKTGTTGVAGARKPNVLGAKKTKLGAKKIGGDVSLDFEEAERKAKEEEERKAKLGYDPDEDTPEPAAATKTSSATNDIVAPTPLSPPRTGSFGTTKPRERSNSEMERLGMGVARLGFGQTSKPAQKKMGFGAVSRGAAVEGN